MATSNFIRYYRRARRRAETQNEATLLRELRRARTMTQKRALSWTWWVRVHVLKDTLQKKGYYASPERDGLLFQEWCDDIPLWAIPGFGTLGEKPESWQWMTWTAPDGVQIHAFMETECRNHSCYKRFMVWRLEQRPEFLGFFQGYVAARRATGIEPGRIVTKEELWQQAHLQHSQ